MTGDAARTDRRGVMLKAANGLVLSLLALVAFIFGTAETPPGDPWRLHWLGNIFAAYGLVWLIILVDACRRHDHYRRLLITLAGGLGLLAYLATQLLRILAAL